MADEYPPSAIDWRDLLARALHKAHMPWCDYTYPFEHPMASREVYEALADAALAAVKKAGYRIHHDHDMQYPKNWGYGPFARAQCRRCGHYDTDLGMPTMSCEPTAPRTEPAPAGEQQ